jgi:hypothetical protein
MSRYSVYKYAVIVWLIVGPIFLILAVNVSKYFIVALFALATTCGGVTLSLKCPGCGQRCAKRSLTVGGRKLYYWGGFTVPRSCSRCGYDLSRSERSGP